MEDSPHITAIIEGRSLRTNEEIMARRVKNRERQRRYRARKRLEADMRNSCVTEPRSMMIIEPQPYEDNVMLESSGASDSVETLAQDLTASRAAIVYSGRKWKKDARLADSSRIQESAYGAKSQSEADPNSELPTISSGRRDWKADARNKMDVSACELSVNW